MQWKTVLFLVSIAVMTSHSYAEYETVNVFGSIGGGFGMGGFRYRSTDISNNSSSVKDRFFNYGSGFKFDIGCQYFAMENVAIQPSFSYSVGTPVIKENITDNTSRVTTYHRHLFGIKLQVVPRFEVLSLINMYTGVGLGFYWNAQPFQDVYKVEGLGIEAKEEASGKITSKPALGFMGMLGTDYPLNDKLTLFGEIGCEQVSFSLDKFVVEKGSIATDTPQRAVGTTYYSKDDANPDNNPPEKVPGTNFQIRVGIRFAIK
jgi:opacity protein-like surface antigen